MKEVKLGNGVHEDELKRCSAVEAFLTLHLPLEADERLRHSFPAAPTVGEGVTEAGGNASTSGTRTVTWSQPGNRTAETAPGHCCTFRTGAQWHCNLLVIGQGQVGG